MSTDDGAVPTATELAMLRGEVMTALARIEGEIRLVRQAQEDAARRTDDLQRDVRNLDDRVDQLEQTRVTREELDAEKRERRADRRVFITAGLSLLVLVLGAVILSALNLK